MTRKYWVLIGVAALLGATSLYINSDWFRGEDIQIVHRPVRPNMVRKRKPTEYPETPVLFSFDRKLALKDVQVFNWADAQTNQYPRALWHMTSDSNSVPTRGIIYGQPIPGMRPAVKGTTPDLFEPGVKYRLVIKAGSQQAQHDFVPLQTTARK